MANIMTESAQWHKHLPSAWVHENPALAALMQAESLTAALKALAAPFSVRLLHLGAVAWQPHEAGFIALAAATPLHGREVLLCLDDVPVVWARSVCAAASPQWRDLLDCGTQPLGARLFGHDLPLQRTAFEYAHIANPHQSSAETVWMRRSAFDWQGEKLYLGEAFLPALAGFLTPRPSV